MKALVEQSLPGVWRLTPFKEKQFSSAVGLPFRRLRALSKRIFCFTAEECENLKETRRMLIC